MLRQHLSSHNLQLNTQLLKGKEHLDAATTWQAPLWFEEQHPPFPETLPPTPLHLSHSLLFNFHLLDGEMILYRVAHETWGFLYST